jgi:hypothetical protein
VGAGCDVAVGCRWGNRVAPQVVEACLPLVVDVAVVEHEPGLVLDPLVVVALPAAVVHRRMMADAARTALGPESLGVPHLDPG